jgi:CO/xanthine dehydrogenase FAD-binding subunit
MNPFRYARAADAQAAAPNGAFLGGGTNLVDHMRLGVRQPDLLIDITQLPFDRIEPLPDGGLRIGALVRTSDLAADRATRQRYPLLSEALLDGASGQLRNLATIGGYIECHHLNPLSERAEQEWIESIRTSLDDVAVVCANCHRMLHRQRPALQIDDLRAYWESMRRTPV